MPPLYLTNLVFVVAFLLSSVASSQDWAEFLGPGGAAKSDDSAVANWNESEHLVWKYDLPGPGSSSPIIVGQRIFATCYSDAGPALRRHIVCVDKNSGEQLWANEIAVDYREDGYSGYITEHGYARRRVQSDRSKCDRRGRDRFQWIASRF